MTEQRFEMLDACSEIIDFSLCVGLYKLCNGRQFDDMSVNTFIDFLNGRLETGSIHPIQHENNRIYYMLRKISDNSIKSKKQSDTWLKHVLATCGLSYNMYQKHSSDLLKFEENIEKKTDSELSRDTNLDFIYKFLKVDKISKQMKFALRETLED